MGYKKCCWYTRKTRTFSKETHESNFILYSYCVTVGKSEVTRTPAESVNVCHSSGLIASIRLKSSHFPLSLPRWESCDSRANTYCLYVDWLRKVCGKYPLRGRFNHYLYIYMEPSYMQHVGLLLKRCACYSIWNACRERLLTHIYSMLTA